MWVTVYGCGYYGAVHVQLHYYVHVSRVAALGHDQQLALPQEAARKLLRKLLRKLMSQRWKVRGPASR